MSTSSTAARPGPWLDTAGPARSLVRSIFVWLAKQERERMIERTVAGMERAKRGQGDRPAEEGDQPLECACAASAAPACGRSRGA